MTWLDRTPFWLVLVVGLWLAVAPVFPEPHLWEKLKMLANGTLVRGLDIFDLCMHGAGVVLFVTKMVRMGVAATGHEESE